MNSNVSDENSNSSDDTCKESTITLNNLSLTEEPENSTPKNQDEPDHNLTPQNLNNQTNTHNISITITSSRVPSPNNHRCNVSHDNSVRMHPWINIAHFRIDPAKFLSGGFCTLRHVNPNLEVFFNCSQFITLFTFNSNQTARTIISIKNKISITKQSKGAECI